MSNKIDEVKNEFTLRVIKMLNKKKWTLGELQDIDGIVKDFADTIYGEMSPKEKLDMVWHEQVNGRFFGEMLQDLVMQQVSEDIAVTLKDLLLRANVNFNGEDKNEVSERSLGRESPKERPSDETSDSEE